MSALSEEAIDEAAEAIRYGIDRMSIWDLAKSALEAAAPFIRVQALEDAAAIVESEEADQWRKSKEYFPGAQVVAQRMQVIGSVIRARAMEEVR